MAAGLETSRLVIKRKFHIGISRFKRNHFLSANKQFGFAFLLDAIIIDVISKDGILYQTFVNIIRPIHYDPSIIPFHSRLIISTLLLTTRVAQNSRKDGRKVWDSLQRSSIVHPSTSFFQIEDRRKFHGEAISLFLSNCPLCRDRISPRVTRCLH